MYAHDRQKQKSKDQIRFEIYTVFDALEKLIINTYIFALK